MTNKDGITKSTMQEISPIRIFIGYDPREALAFSVLAHSIHVRASRPVSITPLMLSQLGQVYRRERNPLQSTDFSFSRFLVPYLSGFSGWSVFLDCDMLVLDDIAKLWALRDERYAIQVVKHDHVPAEEIKFLDAAQTRYEKKNWSSVVLFNNTKCKALTPDYVNTASGLDLHQFKWLDDEALIGHIPHRWNHLVGYDTPSREVSLAHYTIGGPYFEEYRDCEYSDEWRAELAGMLRVDQRQAR
ncbi:MULTISPECIES: glycosyltransferase [Methylococcus]|uniref:Glycosyltransferase n=1 Tax=Methylococcus capsulatus TaxID=414 RepID=A0ABZ2F2I6_METCP|nr:MULTISPECIES: glycosyltransferase [Methylococcus]